MAQNRGWVLAAAALLLGCSEPGDDACTLGDTMARPELSDDFDARAESPQLRLTWLPGSRQSAELPSRYFDAAKVAPETSEAVRQLIEHVEHSAARELTLRFRPLAQQLMSSQGRLGFTLELPDRKDFIECSRAGAADRYLLDVNVSVDEAGALVRQRVSQRIELGKL